MTTTTLTRSRSTAIPGAADAAALLTAQADAGVHAAELLESPAWRDAVPLVARLAAVARWAADGIEGGTAHGAGVLPQGAPVPAVVWARELAATQLLLRRALRGVAAGVDAGDATAAVLDTAAAELRALCDALAAMSAFVAREAA